MTSQRNGPSPPRHASGSSSTGGGTRPGGSPDQPEAADAGDLGTGNAMSPGDEAPPDSPGAGENVCPDCGGSGKVDGQTCDTCQGSGKVITGIGGA